MDADRPREPKSARAQAGERAGGGFGQRKVETPQGGYGLRGHTRRPASR